MQVMKTPFRSDAQTQKQRPPLDSSWNFETFKSKLCYTWINNASSKKLLDMQLRPKNRGHICIPLEIMSLLAGVMDVHGAKATKSKNSAQGEEVDKSRFGCIFVVFGPS